MGQTTEMLSLHPNIMAAQLIVWDGATNRFVAKFAQYGTQGYDHVELILMSQLYAHYNNDLTSVPNGSRITIFCPWSPCSKCTRETIPGFVRDLGAVSRKLIVKFIFQTYYRVANFPNVGAHPDAGQTRWANDLAAQQAYATLLTQFGTVPSIKQKHTTATQFTVSSTPVLQVKQVGTGSLTRRDVFNIADFA